MEKLNGCHPYTLAFCMGEKEVPIQNIWGNVRPRPRPCCAKSNTGSHRRRRRHWRVAPRSRRQGHSQPSRNSGSLRLARAGEASRLKPLLVKPHPPLAAPEAPPPAASAAVPATDPDAPYGRPRNAMPALPPEVVRRCFQFLPIGEQLRVSRSVPELESLIRHARWDVLLP